MRARAAQPSTAPALAVELQFAEGVTLADHCDVERWIQRAHAVARDNRWDLTWLGEREQHGAVTLIELCVRVVDEAEGTELNAAWRGKDYATNVLSFPADIVLDGQAMLGDLVLCAPVIEREAQEQRKTVADHCAHLCVHGVLHLLGYDHVQEAEAEAMEAMEVTVLGAYGCADPYREIP